MRLAGSAGTGGSAGSAGAAGITCTELCAQVAPLGCDKGPPSESLCVAFCDGTAAGTDACADAMKAVLACETTSSAMSCDSAGYVTSPSCASEWTAVNPCLPQV